jgi:CheY-like chemotaxis protein
MREPNTNGSRRILVVEDEEILRTLLGTFLEVLKYGADMASSTDEARKILTGNRTRPNYWCVISDNRAPRDDAGIELLADLRSSGYEGRRILMSGDNITGLQPGVQADSEICDVFLRKPFTYSALDSALKQQREIYAATSKGI